MEVPKEIRDAAKRIGNSINHYGKIDGKDVYGVGSVDINGVAVPAGLPVFLLWDGEKVSQVGGYDALNLLHRLIKSSGMKWED